jgi:5'-nucleotidase
LRILVTNDDGIHAEGLVALERIAAKLSGEVWVCAPEYEQSGASRALTLAEPIRVRTLGERRFATTGTPTDCVMLAITELMAGQKPDLVLSGVNRGANVAEDVTMSGTVAGAIEGMAMGVPAIALSQTWGPASLEPNFEVSEAYAPGIIKRLIEVGWPSDVVLNLNFPNHAPPDVEVEVTRQGFRDIHNVHAERRTDLRGLHYYWMGFSARSTPQIEGTDLRAIEEGRISVTPVHIDLTHMPSVHTLKGVVGGAVPKIS